MTFFSYARNREDVLLFRALSRVRNGFYIDIGVADPDKDSVTRAFYDRGWVGVNVAASAKAFNFLKSTRIYDVNVDSTSDLPDVLSVSYPQRFSRGTGDRKKRSFHEAESTGPSVTNVVHFVRIGEGVDAAAIESIRLQNLLPWIIVVVSPQSEHEALYDFECERLIRDAGFNFVCFDGANRFYVSSKKHELNDAFKVPVNLRDDYIPIEEHILGMKVRRLEVDMKDSELKLMELEYAFRCAQEAHDNAVSVIDNVASIQMAIEYRPLQYLGSRFFRWLMKKGLAAARKLLREAVRFGYRLGSRCPVVFNPLKKEIKFYSIMKI
jgi:hypothetical protein